MTDVTAYKKAISEYYGFKEELIEDVESCGLWHVRFTVNHIKYYGCVCHAGAEPLLSVEGTDYQYWDHNLPVTEEYYNQFIAGKRMYIRYAVEPDAGEWIRTGDVFVDLCECKAFIQRKPNPDRWDYEYDD